MIIDYIPEGKDNAISVSDLMELLNMSNRAIRKEIEKARRTFGEYVIISSSKFKGYYKTKNPREIADYTAEQTKRAKKILWNLRSANKTIGDYGQYKITWEKQ